MKNLKEKLLAVVLSCMLVFSVTVPAFAASVNSDGNKKTIKSDKKIESIVQTDLKTMIKDVSLKGMQNSADPTSGTYAGEWTVYAVNRGSKLVSGISGLDAWNQKYVENITAKISEFTAVEDYVRAIFALSAIGYDLDEQVGGVKLVDKMLEDMNEVKGGWGVSRPLMVLAAIDISGVSVSKDVTDEIIDYVFDSDSVDKDTRTFGYADWYTGEWTKDFDTAGTALYALAPYMSGNENAKTLVEANKKMIVDAVKESEDGNLPTMGSKSCTDAQAILGLIALGEDVDSVVNTKGLSLIDGLKAEYLKDEKMFPGYDGSPDIQSSDQALQALVAYLEDTSSKYKLGSFGKIKVKTSTTKATVSNYKVSGAKKYEIYMSTKKSSGFKKVKTLTATSFTKTGLKSGTVYYFYVRAINGNNIKKSATVSAETKMAAPKTVKAVAGKKKVTVKFSKSANAKKYYIYRSTKKTKGFKKISAVKKLKYVDKKVKKGKKYFYKVKAVKSSKNISAFSKVVKTKKVQ